MNAVMGRLLALALSGLLLGGVFAARAADEQQALETAPQAASPIPEAASPAPEAAPPASGPVEQSPAAQPASVSPASDPVATETPSLSPVALALREAFAEIAARPRPRDGQGAAARDVLNAISAYYAARNFAPVWREGDDWSAAAPSAIARLQRAGEDALDSSGWRVPALSASDANAIAAADIALSQAVVLYGRQASGGRVAPSSISRLITAKPEVASVEAILAKVAAAGGNAGDVLQGFNPPHPGYRALRVKLAEIRGAKPAPQETPVAIGPGPILRVGMSDQRVPLIRARFGLTPNEPNIDPLVYDTRVAGAIADFQRSKGMRANGVLTQQTVSALAGQTDATLSLEGEIVSNMERWRWLPRDLGQTHIFVNIPEFMVRVYNEGQRIHETKVIVGATKTPSPVFSHRMQFLVVNPSWHVPASIIREYGGAEKMAAKGFEVRQTSWGVAVRQPPGPRNALGYVKFMFPNEHSVYLHDTPGRHLFNASMRALSHGCIRVHEPFKLAEVLMGAGSTWNEKRLRAMIGSGERTVPLPRHLPIHLAYFTTFVDEDGQLQQRPDLYGHSRRLMNALGYKSRT